MSLYTLGLNHQTAPLDVREQIAFQPEALGMRCATCWAGRRSRKRRSCRRATGPRSTSTAPSPSPSCAGSRTSTRCRSTRWRPYIYTLPREQAITHAFRVASGLDSMVLGEPQILGQMKQAVRHAESAGALGLVLNRLFQRTFAVAKDVRTHTDIGSASISMAAASVKLAERLFPSISDQRLLLIGAGEMIELTATHFAARKPEVDHHRQPDDRARPGARRALRRDGDHAERDAGPACTSSTSSSPARRARCRSSARACSSAW